MTHPSDDQSQPNGCLTHQDIGRDLKLFFSDPVSPGSPFFLPHGTHIYNKLIEMLRNEYNKLGYQEVSTPVICNDILWETSGHSDKYYDNMFHIESKDDTTLIMSPMNCPKHCIIFRQMDPSYRELPIRLAEFGILHRNELTGSLTGLTRVRKFIQDDAHIFCTLEQVDNEIKDIIHFIVKIYGLFNFEFSVELSTRPEKYIGDIETWNKAENILKSQIKLFNDWKINEGDGAFYGPKIDISIKDSLNRYHQCGTIQLDFNLPERFDLKYYTADQTNKTERPIIIHRAILGSIERFIAILLEHTKGNLPFWLSPRQVAIIPVVNEYLPYANEVKKSIGLQYKVYIDESRNTLNKKIRSAQKMKFNYIIVVGETEIDHKAVNVRSKNENLGEYTVDDLKELFNQLLLD